MAEPLLFIVDDDPLSASNLAAVLAQEAGYEIRTFTSLDALDALATEDVRPDAVITGHKSTGLDGLALIDRLRQADPDVVGLVMTRAADEEATARALAAVGPLRHLHKPCSMADLLPRLRLWLERRQLQQGLRETRSMLASRSQALAESAREVERAEAELRTTHTELRAATERLVQAEQMAAVGRVAAAIAYELSRQLALVGYAEAIKSRVASDPELVELANIIVAAQKRLAAMVDEIRDFAAADGDGRGAFHREPADVAAVVDEALAIMRYDRDACQRTIERRYHGRPLAALHHHKFSQVVINLVSNAVQATRPGDVIVVELDMARDDGPGGKRVAALTVSDPGVGMPAEVLARLGEPFFTTRGDRGSGLGVGICMRIVEEHGGRLTYSSQVGRGTTARVTIPLLLDAASEPAPGPREDWPA
ncbi:MAG TPA: hybrid sensor histidine kinase/response regulator [Haliangium sp.]|nr:hybrid sensor histidine kinase/response regulator [Haliangium sp.]